MSEATQSVLFRQKLYENFKQSGLLSQLKTTLRANLLQKLQRPRQTTQQCPQRLERDKSKPLHLRDKFLACIVAQYLQKTNKQYSLSILLPESNLQTNDCLNYTQLAQITNVNIPQQNEKTFLETLIEEWTKIRFAQIRQRSTQTDFSQPLSKKLEDIQKQYKPKIDYWKFVPPKKQSQSENSDISLLAKQQKLKEQLQLQKKRIRRQIQLSVKAEMQKKYDSQYQFKTKQLQKAFEGRLTELKNREKAIIDSLNRKTKEVEDKARRTNEEEMKMIKKYEDRIMELQIEHRNRLKQTQAKQKQFWKKQLQIKAKKREYEDTLRLVKQKVVEQTLNI